MGYSPACRVKRQRDPPHVALASKGRDSPYAVAPEAPDSRAGEECVRAARRQMTGGRRSGRVERVFRSAVRY